MTNQTKAPRTYYAPQSRAELAKAMKKDNKKWLINTPIDEFRKKFGFSGANRRTQEEIDAILALSRQISGPESCLKVLRAIGGMLQGTADELGELAPRLIKGEKSSFEDVTIKFHSQGNQLLRNAPEETCCRPDIVAYNQNRLRVPQYELPVSALTQSNTQDDTTSPQGSTQSYTTEDDLTWTQTEATSEYISAQDNNTTGLEKAISPSGRTGIFFAPKVFNLIFSGATGTCHTLLKWDDPEHLQLLFEFVERIFKPSPEMLDHNIVRNTNDTFDIILKEEKYSKCKTLSLGRPIGRRTTIFETSDPEAPIIKEQYLTSPSVEYDILRQVLSVPGVVRIKDHGEYRPEEESEKKSEGAPVGCTIKGPPRYKVRMTLRDKGVPIVESETLEQFLIRLYDTLEVAESLYRVGVLHRDYSLNNVLFREPVDGKEQEGSTFCSARHLLDADVGRLATEVLLIDFEYATTLATQRGLESAGTPLYRARAAGEVAPLEMAGIMPGMPELIPEALERYQEALPNRLKQFYVDEGRHLIDHVVEKKRQAGNKREWHHELRHDVESVFWMLLHWVIVFRPKSDTEPPKIPSAFWAPFTNEIMRGSLITVVKKEKRDEGNPWLHPDLDTVRELLAQMATHLDGEIHWLPKDDRCYEQMTNTSYLREVFQRLILNFLFKRRDEPFMNLKRHKDNRPIEEAIQRSAPLSAQVVASRQSKQSGNQKRIREEEDQEGSAKKKKSNALSNDSSNSDYKRGK